MSEPDNLQFVDTDILIYAHDVSVRQKHVRARDLVRGLWQSGESCLSIQVLQEFYVNVTQEVLFDQFPPVRFLLIRRLLYSF
jgi:predicted nucleic acid-binding protein